MTKPSTTMRELISWINSLRSLDSLDDAILAVFERFRAASGEEHSILGSELASLMERAGHNSDALVILDELLRVHPDDVRHAIGKSGIYLYTLDRPDKALECIDIALERAYRTGFFRREALGDKARILLKLGRGDELSDVLEEIMSLQMTKDIPDIARERDFVDRAPPGFIREDALARYNLFRPKRPDDTSANEPPKYEPSDD